MSWKQERQRLSADPIKLHQKRRKREKKFELYKNEAETLIPFFNFINFTFFPSPSDPKAERNGSESSFDLFAMVAAHCSTLSPFLSISSLRNSISFLKTTYPWRRRRSCSMPLRPQLEPVGSVRSSIDEAKPIQVMRVTEAEISVHEKSLQCELGRLLR